MARLFSVAPHQPLVRFREAMQRKSIAAGTKWEPIVGYSRAGWVGSFVFVSGTAATNEAWQIIGQGDPCAQTVHAIKNVEKASHAAGATLQDVVRTWRHVTNIADWEQVEKAHGEFFVRGRPATSRVEVNRSIAPEMLVGIGADAMLVESRAGLDRIS